MPKSVRIPAVHRNHVALLVVIAATIAFYVWTAVPAGLRFGDRPDAYNALARGFLHGHLYLDRQPPRRLLALPNPHDPAEYEPLLDSDERDLVLYHNHFYATWGPSPALVLFVPSHLLGLKDLSPALAILLLTAVGFVCASLLLILLTRRFVPRTRTRYLAAGIIALGFSSVGGYLIRTPEPYEVAVAGGYAFSAAGLLALACAFERPRRRTWLLVAASALLGLALAARIDLVLLGLVLVAVFVALWRSGELPDRGARWRAAAALALPFGACLGAYMAYNALRFGAPDQLGYGGTLHFGQNPGAHRQIANVLPGLWYYLFAPNTWRLQFPFFWPVPPPSFWGPTPSGYGPVEGVGGLFGTSPISLVLPLSAGWLVSRRRTLPRGLGATIGVLVATSLLIAVFIGYGAPTATMRYVADFATLALIASILAWAYVLRRARARGRRRYYLIARGGVVLIVYGALVGTSFSMIGNRRGLAITDPAAFRALQNFFNPIPTTVAQLAGHPLIASVDADSTLPRYGYDHLSLEGTAFDVGLASRTMRVFSPRTGVFRFLASAQRMPGVHGTGKILTGVSANLTGQYVAVQARPAAVSIPIRLHRGANDVSVVASTDVRSVELSPDGNLVRLLDIRMR